MNGKGICFFMTFGVLALIWSQLATTAEASMFGPKNFEECILKNMKGVSSDIAAELIAQACGKKFSKSLPSDFEERFGKRGTLAGHVYEKGRRNNIVRMKGASVRLLKPEVVKSLVAYLKVRDDMRQKAAQKEIEQFRQDSLRKAPAARVKAQGNFKAAEAAVRESESHHLVLTSELDKLRSELVADIRVRKILLAKQRTADTVATKSDNARLTELRENKGFLARQLKKKKNEFAAAQATADRKFHTDQKSYMNTLAARKAAELALRSELKAGRRSIKRKSDIQIAWAVKRGSKLESQIRKAKQDLQSARIAKARALRAAYLREKIQLKTSYDMRYASIGKVEPCFRLVNGGKLAIRRLIIGVKFKGRPTNEIGFDVNNIMSLSILLPLVDYKRQFNKSIQPSIENKYQEKIYGVPPGAAWPKQGRGCASLSKYSVKGDIQRAFEKVGGFSYDKWSFYLKSVDLADPEKIASSTKRYSSEKVWKYPSQNTLQIFKKQVNAAIPATEPSKRKKRLSRELVKVRGAIQAAKKQKKSNLSKYAKENKSRLNRLRRQRKAAEAALTKLMRPEIDDTENQTMQGRFQAVGTEIERIEKSISVRTTDFQTMRKDLRRKTGAQQSQIDKLVSRIEFSTKNIEAREKALMAAGSALNTFNETLAAFEKGQGKAWDKLLKEFATNEIINGASIDKQWLQGILELLGRAAGAEARVDLNGAYKFTNLPQGSYLVYVYHVYRRTAVLWLEPITVGKEAILELGSFNSIVKPSKNIQDVLGAIRRLKAS